MSESLIGYYYFTWPNWVQEKSIFANENDFKSWTRCGVRDVEKVSPCRFMVSSLTILSISRPVRVVVREPVDKEDNCEFVEQVCVRL
jgi:hypothetical protein